MKAIDLLSAIKTRFGDAIVDSRVCIGEVTIELKADDLLSVSEALRDEKEFQFDQLIDVCGVDYSAFGETEWATESTTDTGFSRGVDVNTGCRLPVQEKELSVEGPLAARRFASVYHLLSMPNNHRLRIKVFPADDQLPVVPSVLPIWSSANWFEREAFDLFGIMYEGHPDLRRILTDYGFIGHPFRKDFPLSGNVEVIYDAQKRRVIYQPVSIEPRVLVPKVIRGDALPDDVAAPVVESAEEPGDE